MKTSTRILVKTYILFILSLSVGLCCFKLALWQGKRYLEKKESLQAYAAHTKQAPWDVLMLERSYPPPRFQSIVLEGYFDNAHTFLLDNRFYKHKLGYEVITPFVIQPSFRGFSRVLVHRGFIERSAKRSLPIQTQSDQKITVKGFAEFAIASGLAIGPNENNPSQWPRVVQRFILSDFQTALGSQALPAFVIKLSDASPGGFLRAPSNDPSATVSVVSIGLAPERHLGYAIQWLLLGLVVIGMAVYHYLA